MVKSVIKQQYPNITSTQLRRIKSSISDKCSEYYFLGFMRSSSGNVDDALKFFSLDQELRSLILPYIIIMEIQLKKDFAIMIEHSTRSKQFWKVNKYYDASTRLRRPGKRSKCYLTKKKIEKSISKLHPRTIGPLNHVAMYSISFGTFEMLFNQIDTRYEQDFINKYTSHLSVHSYNILTNYFESFRYLRNRCSHGSHIITKKVASDLRRYGGSVIVDPANNPLHGQYVSYFEMVLLFMIKQLNCGDEFKHKLRALLGQYANLLASYPTGHSLSTNTIGKIV